MATTTKHDPAQNQYETGLACWLGAILLDPPAPADRLARLLAVGVRS